MVDLLFIFRIKADMEYINELSYYRDNNGIQ